jgi:hypothetical protein
MILEKYLEIAYGLKEKQWSKILQGSILSLLYYLVYFSLLRLCKDKILNKGKFFKSMAETIIAKFFIVMPHFQIRLN